MSLGPAMREMTLYGVSFEQGPPPYQSGALTD